LGLPANECVVVGDSPVDILAGKAAGSSTIAAAYGYGTREELMAAAPSRVIERFADLPSVLNSLERGNP
ncbi:MAG: HAD family hydrolase, partial [Methanobacteriota archaeon]